MSWFPFLKRGKQAKRLPLIRTVQAPGTRRVERRQAPAVVRPPDQERRKSRQIDPVYEDTGSLELDRDSQAADNPYETHSWTIDPRVGTRRVDDLKAINRDRSGGGEDNPYDTGVGRKGW